MSSVTQAPSVALVGERRIQVAVTQHHLSIRQGRPYHLLHQMRASGRVQQGLRTRGHTVISGVQQHTAYSLAHRGAARLASHQHHVAPLPKCRGQQLHLSRLATPVEALEGYEHAFESATHAGQGRLVQSRVFGRVAVHPTPCVAGLAARLAGRGPAATGFFKQVPPQRWRWR